MKKVISRRTFLTGTAGILAAPAVMRSTRASANSGSVTYVTWGGSWQDIQMEHAIKPFTKETGIEVNVVTGPDLAKVKAQQMSGNIEWDVVDCDGPMAAAGSRQGFWDPLDKSMLDVEDLIFPMTDDYVPFSTTTCGLAWDPAKSGPGKHPMNFPEYFDLGKFPGRRTFRNKPNETLETALLADGVAAKDLYPLDVDRAFKALDRIKSSIAAWTAATSQSISLLQTGEVDFSFTYSNRVKTTTEPGGGVPLAFSFDQVLFDTEPMAVVKGAPNKENAMKFIAFSLRPEIQARVGVAAGCLPVSKKAMALISPEDRKWMPDIDKIESSNSVVINSTWWADNEEVVSRRFKEWILS